MPFLYTKMLNIWIERMAKQLGAGMFLFINIILISFFQSNRTYMADMVIILNCVLVALALRLAISI